MNSSFVNASVSGSDSQIQPQQQPSVSTEGGGGCGVSGSGHEEDEFYPLAVLIEELRNEDVRFRLNSIQRLSTIAVALGPEKTRTQLIPFLTDTIYDVEDVMVAIAEELGRFVPYVGGIAYAPCLINPLESLSLVEDANVREKAVQSLRLLAREHIDKDLQEQIFPLVRRLATGDWFSSRASACGLFAVVYGRLDVSARQDILSFAQTLANDETPMVRRALAAVLGELALAMVGIAPVSDAAAAPSLVGNACGSPGGVGSANSDQEAADDCSLDRLPAGQQDTESTSAAILPAVANFDPDSFSFAPIEETPEVEEARNQIVTSLVPLFNSLAFKDDQESVRLIALEAAVPLARALGPNLAEQHIVQGLQRVLDFKSWRSRCLLAKKLALLQTCLGPRVTKNCLIDLFLTLLADDIAEVRCAAASQITNFTNGLLNGEPVSMAVSALGTDQIDSVTTSATTAMEGVVEGVPKASDEGETEDPSTPKALGDAESFIVRRLLPAMADLNTDSNVHVKVKLGQAVLGLAPLLGRDLTVTHLLPIILAQLKDESPDVRLGVITSLDLVNNVVGVEEVSASLLPAIVELAKVPVWRVRLAVINQIPLLADQLGEKFFETRLMQHFFSWLADAAYAVREAAVLNLTRLTQKFGTAWARTFFLSQIADLSQSKNYLQRMISLQCIINLSPVIDADTCSQFLLPTALSMDHDRVPNVRFKVAQALAKVGMVVGAEMVMPCLQRLLVDPDTDVRFYAAEAMDLLKQDHPDRQEVSGFMKMDVEPGVAAVISLKTQNSSLEKPPPISTAQTPSNGIDLRTEILALAAFDQKAVQSRRSDLNIALKNFFSSCDKITPSKEAKTPAAFFGGLGLFIFRSMEEKPSVKAFRVLPEVQQRLSEICTLVTGSDSFDNLGNLLHDLRQVIFLLGINPHVEKAALLALIRRAWYEVSGSTAEDTDWHLETSRKSDFGEVEGAALIDLFSVTSTTSRNGHTVHLDAIELAMRRNVEKSIRQNNAVRSTEGGFINPDEWTRLRSLLDPVCRNLKMDMKQVIDMLFGVLQSSRSDEVLQSELIDFMGFDHFDTVSILIRERTEWLLWYKKFAAYPDSFVRNKETPHDCRAPSGSGKKAPMHHNGNSVADKSRVVQQLLTHPEVLENARQAELLTARSHAMDVASEAYYRSLDVSVDQQSRVESFPFVFDALADLVIEGSVTERSKMVLPVDAKHCNTNQWEVYDIPPPLRPEEIEKSGVNLVQKRLPNGGALIEIASLDRIAQLAFKGIRQLNLVQSVVFEMAYNSTENLLISAPTGAGKTNTALLAIIHLIRQHINPMTGVLETNNFKIVYMAPMKALAAEMTENFGKRLAPLGVRVKECTGDMQLSAQEILETQMLVTTPEKWDVISRKGAGDSSLVQSLKLLIIDEVHLLHEERGAVIEALVARTLRQVEASQRLIRIVGLSATLPNYFDIASFLRVNPRRGLFYFDARFRPVPLGMSFIGVRASVTSGSSGDANADLLMNQACYERVIQQLRQSQQVIVFVHARGETVRTARWLLDKASQSGESALFEPSPSSRTPEFIKRVGRTSDLALRELLPRGVGCHHAGMLRLDRTLVERLFREGTLRLLVCTATLAWGVNLPAHAVIIKGTRIYDPDRSDYVDLDILDVLQIFGRAGRPQFDKSGVATIITTQDKLDRYIRLITNQVPIESKLLNNLNDHLNAEIALGTISNVSEAITWLSYTYFFVRLTKSPLTYGITTAMLMDDPDLTNFLTKTVEGAARELDDAEMIRFEPSTGQLASTDRGRTASLYYISYATAALVRQRLQPLMLFQDLISLISEAREFAQMKVRDEEETDLLRLHDEACQVLVKNPGTVGGTLAVKVNVLLQAHISRARPATHSLISDMFYVQQNAGRLARYMFEIALRQGWSVCATSAHRLSKMIELRLWHNKTPLWQFIDPGVESCRLLERVDELSLRVDKIRELDPTELKGILRYQGVDGAEYVCRLARHLPLLTMVVDTQPITRNILRINVRLTPDFTWTDRHHGNNGALLYWLWVEDPDEMCIYHSEAFTLTKKMMKTKAEPMTELVFTIPVHEPLPSQYLVHCISDRFLGAESVIPINLRNILLPHADPPHTDLLPLDPLPVKALHNQLYEKLYSFTHFNPIQTQVFHTLYHQDVNVLLGAPTGSGKTAVAELAIFRVFNTLPRKKCVYIAPLKALVRERVEDWSVRIGKRLGKRVIELTGDVNPDVSLLKNADVIVTTPEKWDGISRSWRQRNYVCQIALIVIDEIHMVGEDRGPVLEAIVSRANFIANQLNTRIRLVGLSTALSNAIDMAVWLRVPLMPLGMESGCSGRGLFNFRPSVRPVPLEVHIQAFPGRHYCPRMALMNKPIFRAIQSHSATKPVLVFVASRRQTRLTAFELISYASSDLSPRRWLHMNVDEMEALASTLKDKNLQVTLPYGIGIHHAGLRDNDRRIVEELFVNQKIQVLIATSTLAWGVNFPAHLVIVKGTEYFDGRSKRYIDYPITDVLQMMGRAGRPQFDSEGKAIVMVQDTKKAFYKRFLYEPFPVESCLPRILPDYLNAEIASGSVSSMQAAMECITWTFYFRRLLMNPNYYQLEDTSAAGVSAFLSSIVSEAVERLVDAGCVEVGDSEEGANVLPLHSTPMGWLASFYYISYKTIHLFTQSLSSTTNIEDLIYILSMSEEFADIPVRHGEDEVNATLAREMPLRLLEPPESGHAKAHLLLQAHLSRRTNRLPVADYVTDTTSLLEQIPRLLAALLNFSALSGQLATALRCAILGQMISRALWLSDSPLLQLSNLLDSSHLAVFQLDENRYVETLPELMEVIGAAPRFSGLRGFIGDRLAPEIVEQIGKILPCLPVVSVDLSLVSGSSKQSVPIIGLDVTAEEARRRPLEVQPDTDYALCVNLHYESIPSLMPRDQGGRQSQLPGWVIVLGEPIGTETGEGGRLLALKRATFRRNASLTNTIILSFRLDESTTVTEEVHELSLYLMSDMFLSMDQQLSFCLRLVPLIEERNDIDVYN